MKKREITYYMLPEYPVTIIEDMEEGGYTITLPDCPGCVTRCERWEDIPATIADAQREWLEAVTENITPPDPDEEEFDDEGEYQGEFKGALNYYMSLDYNIVVIRKGLNCYRVALREIPKVSAFGPTPEAAVEMLRRAKENWLLDAFEEGIPIPLPQQDGSKVINISFN